MWRAFFLAMGISLMIVGAESLAVDQAVLIPRTPSAKTSAEVVSIVVCRLMFFPPLGLVEPGLTCNDFDDCGYETFATWAGGTSVPLPLLPNLRRPVCRA